MASRAISAEEWCSVPLSRQQLNDTGFERGYRASCLLKRSKYKSKRRSAALASEARHEGAHSVPIRGTKTLGGYLSHGRCGHQCEMSPSPRVLGEDTTLEILEHLHLHLPTGDCSSPHMSTPRPTHSQEWEGAPALQKMGLSHPTPLWRQIFSCPSQHPRVIVQSSQSVSRSRSITQLSSIRFFISFGLHSFIASRHHRSLHTPLFPSVVGALFCLPKQGTSAIHQHSSQKNTASNRHLFFSHNDGHGIQERARRPAGGFGCHCCHGRL